MEAARAEAAAELGDAKGRVGDLEGAVAIALAERDAALAARAAGEDVISQLAARAQGQRLELAECDARQS